MADIAFLLLLFFLVTTTMDRDQAYIRQIPEPLENPPENVKIEKRNILAIKANSKEQLMVRGEVFTNPDNISDFILKFYQTSEKENHPELNFPQYSTVNMKIINKNIKNLKKNKDDADSLEQFQLASYFEAQINEWKLKEKSLKLYGKSEMREIDRTAHIRIEVFEETSYAIFTKIHSEIEEAIVKLRNEKCKDLFGESYSKVKKRYNQDKKQKDKDVMDLIEILYPLRIVEATPKN